MQRSKTPKYIVLSDNTQSCTTNQCPVRFVDHKPKGALNKMKKVNLIDLAQSLGLNPRKLLNLLL